MSITRYLVRIVQDDDREGPVAEVPVAVFSADFEAATDAASMILRGYVIDSRNDLRCYLDEWTAREPEFHPGMIVTGEGWASRSFATLTTAKAMSGDPVAWDT